MANAWNGTCPRCDNPHAYQGFSEWECPNERCSFFTKKQKELVDEELSQQRKAEEILDVYGECDLSQVDHEENYNKVIDQMYGLWSNALHSDPQTTDNQKPSNDASEENDDNDYIYAYNLTDPTMDFD